MHFGPRAATGHLIVRRHGDATDTSACTFKQEQRAPLQTRVRLVAILN